VGRLAVLLAGVAVSLASLPLEALAQSGVSATPTSDVGSVPPPPTDAAVAEAREAFREGTRLARLALWTDALQAFERSSRLHPHPVTTYNVGYCERLLGHWTRARKAMRTALEQHKAGRGTELPPELLVATEAILFEADREIAHIVVTVSAEGGAVAVDGRPLEVDTATGDRSVAVAGTRPVGPPEPPPAQTFEIQLDPGSHIFAVASKGRADVLASQTFAPGAQGTLELRVTSPELPGAAMTPALDGERAATRRMDRVPAFVALAVASAGLATGAVSGIVALGKKDEASHACGSGGDVRSCDSQLSGGNLAADVSTAGFIVGGVGVAMGAAMLLVGWPSRSPTSVRAAPRSPSVAAWLGLPGLGLTGSF
jgi:hypothetical protein